MKHYQCHKKVHARPMLYGQYVEIYGTEEQKEALVHPSPYGGKTKTIETHAAGYLVIYSLGTPDEYISWSPKRAFEEGYSEIPQVPNCEPDTYVPPI